MAYNPFSRAQRCEYFKCRVRADIHLLSHLLCIDSWFCDGHGRTLLRNYAAQVTYLPGPPPRRALAFPLLRPRAR